MSDKHPTTLGDEASARLEVEAEERLGHAQRMETFGRFAGTVAHDFNNLLTVITSIGNVVRTELAEQAALRDMVTDMLTAADRATELARQLLVFSRHEANAPTWVDVNALCGETLRLMKRLVPANVRIETDLASELPAVEASAPQLEQAVVNLCVNARDAMDSGGTVLVETRALELDALACASLEGAAPGRYVEIAVSDTGAGIPPAVRGRIFEPFFTTKPRGEGTGLGLAMVLGAVRAHGGSVAVYSEPSRGTTILVLLPVTDPATLSHATPRTSTPTRGGTETVLLVDPSAATRAAVRAALADRGYTVVEAGGAGEARAAATSRPGTIDLLVTDLALLDGRGDALAAEIQGACPGVRALFTAGYTSGAVALHHAVPAGAAFLPRLYTAEALANAVRAALDAPR